MDRVSGYPFLGLGYVLQLEAWTLDLVLSWAKLFIQDKKNKVMKVAR